MFLIFSIIFLELFVDRRAYQQYQMTRTSPEPRA